MKLSKTQGFTASCLIS